MESKDRYEIIASRMKNPDDSFLYGVKTTGIFCRPGCPSRIPLRENTVFFQSADEAMRAGFRPCRKCRPLGGGPDGNSDLVVAVCRMLESGEREPSLGDLSSKTGYSAGHIQKIFRKITGISPREYGAALKSRRFRSELSSGKNVTESLYSAGYGSPGRVYGELDSILAMKPTQFIDRGRGIELRWGLFPCFLGRVLIALTERGVALVEPGDSDESLEAAFRERFRNAVLSPLLPEDRTLIQEVLKKIDNPACEGVIPLDIRGTVFQKRVWKALAAIPAGETATYSGIAGEIGEPSAVRAVANACGRNNLAVLIPCHRVIGKNGKLSGYRWGAERKALLLEREKEIS